MSDRSCRAWRPFAVACLIVLSVQARGQDNMRQSTQPTTGAPDAGYGVNVVYIGWRVKVNLNQQPAFRGGSISGLFDLTPFVVDGKNTLELEITGAAEDSSWPSRCEVHIVKLTNAADGTVNPTLVLSVNDSSCTRTYSARKTLEFEARVPWRWTWQQGAYVDELTDGDKQEIAKAVDAYAQAYRKKDADAVMSAGRRWADRKLPTQLPGTYVPVDCQAITTIARGTKVVLVFVNQPTNLGDSRNRDERRRRCKYLIYAGVPLGQPWERDEVCPYTIINYLYFVRERDRWVMLSRDVICGGQ